MKLKGQTAIVTGAARGLGRAYALHLGSLGADVAIIDIDLNSATAFGDRLTAPTVAAEIRALGRPTMAVDTDIGDPAAAGHAMTPNRPTQARERKESVHTCSTRRSL